MYRKKIVVSVDRDHTVVVKREETRVRVVAYS